MLANSDTTAQSGSLNRDVHLPSTSRNELLGFISNELPQWRDRNDRNDEKAETVLTSQLCAHLNSAARRSTGWDHFQFRTETPDERKKARKIDLIASPCGTAIWIEGRRHSDFDAILPIECKRLPIPKDKDRDEREYVINRYASTGGIQRFKAGDHGSTHKLAGMIAYVQEETMGIWETRIREWITGLIKSEQPGWTAEDFLHLEHNDEVQQITVFRSSHTRTGNLEKIELRHLWLNMNLV